MILLQKYCREECKVGYCEGVFLESEVFVWWWSYERCFEQCMCTFFVLLYSVYIFGFMILLHIVHLYWPSFMYITKLEIIVWLLSQHLLFIFSVLYGQCSVWRLVNIIFLLLLLMSKWVYSIWVHCIYLIFYICTCVHARLCPQLTYMYKYTETYS